MTDIASSPLDTDLCVHVDQRVDHPVGHVWGVVNSPQGVEAWLGSGAKLGGKGEHWYAADGSQGVLRSYHPAEQIRVSWHASDEAPASVVDLHIIRTVPAPGSTCVTSTCAPVTTSRPCAPSGRPRLPTWPPSRADRPAFGL